MTDDNTRIDRRTVIKGLGGAVAAGGVAGAALLASGPAAGANVDIGEPVTVTSNDGSVEYVAIFGDSVVNWEGLDTPATDFSITISAEAAQGWDGQTAVEETVLHETGMVSLDSNWGDDEAISYADGGREGTIESAIGLTEGAHDPATDWHVVGTDPDEYGLPSSSLPAGALSHGHDGETRSYTVTLHSTYAWYDADGNELLSETFSSEIPVDVTNIAESSTASDGDGEDGAVAA